MGCLVAVAKGCDYQKSGVRDGMWDVATGAMRELSSLSLPLMYSAFELAFVGFGNIMLETD